MANKTIVQLSPIDLSPYLNGGTLIAVNVGADDQIYIVVSVKDSYRVIGLHHGEQTLDVHIENEPFDIHDVQPLRDGELLLVCGRSSYRGKDDYDKNGRIYSSDGTFLREILLGDGIQNTQVTLAGTIWTSYYDEGVFGNLGWNDPIGASGLVAWDADGKQLYEFKPSGDLDHICDCYALNVASNVSTWCYYYTAFALVHIHNRQIQDYWQIPVSGSSAFAIDRKHALFTGGYDDRDSYHLFELGRDSVVVEKAQIRLVDQNGDQVAANRTFGRAGSLYVVRGNELFCLDVALTIEQVTA